MNAIRDKTMLVLILSAGLTMTLPVLAEDDPDIEIYQLSGGKDRSVTRITHMDMAMDDRGTLVVAMVERGGYHDAILVTRRDPNTLQWSVLASFITKNYTYDRVKDLNLTVGSRLGPNKDEYLVFMAIVWDDGRASCLGWGCDRLEFYSGPADTAWNRDQCHGTVIAQTPSVAYGSAMAMHPSVAVIPLDAGSYAEFGVGIAWTWFTGNMDEPSRVMLTVFSDYPNVGWSFGTEQIAGPNAHALQGTTFGAASLAADLNNGYWAAAIEDWEQPRVHVIRGRISDRYWDPVGGETLVFSTTQGIPAHHPTLAIDAGEATLLTLGDLDEETGGFALEWFAGRVFLMNDFVDGQTIHQSCRTPADIAVNRGDAWITADCAPDNQGGAWRVFAFTGERDEPENTVFDDTPINDFPATPLQPRVAVEPSPETEVHAVYGYCTEEEVPFGSGPPTNAVYIDP